MLGGGSARVHSSAGGLELTPSFFFLFDLGFFDLRGIVGDVRGECEEAVQNNLDLKSPMRLAKLETPRRRSQASLSFFVSRNS